MERDIENIVEHRDNSEKSIERYLCAQVESLGGICLKYSNPLESGYPDRLCSLPGIIYPTIFFVEVKSRGRKPTPLQERRIRQLKALGHHVYVADSRETVNAVLRDEIQGARISR